MIVEELIHALSTYPGDWIVYKESDYDGVGDTGSVVSARIVRGSQAASACEPHVVVGDEPPADCSSSWAAEVAAAKQGVVITRAGDPDNE